MADALKEVVRRLGDSEDAKKANSLYAALAGGPGIFGLGNRVYEGVPLVGLIDPNKEDRWDLKNDDHINGGVNHFGSPFNFPEEFITVYRLHPLLPDLIEYREWNKEPNVIRQKVPVIETFRGKATEAMRQKGLANWALSMGRQRLGALTLQNHPQFLQNLKMPSPAISHATDRRSRARSHQGPGAGSPALQRVPSAVRAEAIDQLRRLRRYAPTSRSRRLGASRSSS